MSRNAFSRWDLGLTAGEFAQGYCRSRAVRVPARAAARRGTVPKQFRDQL